MQGIVVGVTSVGSGVGQSVVDSCLLSGLPIRLVGFDSSPFAFAAYDCGVFVRLPRVGHPEYLPVLLDSCSRHGVQLLIPGLDLETPILARECGRLEAAGVTLLAGSEAFVGLCRDKLRWSRELGAVSDAIVPSYDLEEARQAAASGTLSFPAIAKPPGGSASTGLVILRDPADFGRLTSGDIVQPFLLPRTEDPNRALLQASVERGQLEQVSEVSYQMVVGKAAAVLGDIATANRLKAGVPVEVVPVDATPWREAVAPLLPHLLDIGMRGPVNLQGRMTDDGVRFFEMNPRFTGITGVRALLGFNEVDALIRDALDLRTGGPTLAVSPRRIGLRQVTDRSVDVSRNNELRSAVGRSAGRSDHDPPLTVMVTGATGYLGRRLLAALMQSPRVAKVVCVVRESGGISPPAEAKACTVLTLADAASTGLGLGRVDLLFHLAGGRPPDGNRAIADGLAFTRQVMDEATRFRLPALVNVSSQAIYGTRPTPWREADGPAPDTPYGMAKLAGEELVGMFCRLSPGSRATSLRVTRIYGSSPGLRWSDLPHKFAKQAVAGEQIVIHGGDQRYDLIHIDDAVAALMRLVGHAEPWRAVYNIGSGGNYMLADMAAAAIHAARNRGQTCPDYRVVPDDTKSGLRRTQMIIESFTNDFGWRPAVDLADGMAELVAAADGPARAHRAAGDVRPDSTAP